VGIPFARNRALELALQQDPDWIGFIDDDEVASRTWIAHFAKAAKSVQCDVFQGPVEYRYPTSTPEWMPLPTRKHQPTGRLLRTAATSNTFMRARVARPDGLGLRFNEAMRFTGGSDNEYFFRAADLGARVCWMDEAVVYESVPENRITLRWQLDRSQRVAANSVLIQRGRLGLLGAIAKFGPKYAGRILYGAIVTPAAAAVSLVAEHTGKRLLVSALRNVSSGLGGLGAFFEYQPEPYRTVDNQ
jgi:succinoglycan biosynthesis protein ExoM